MKAWLMRTFFRATEAAREAASEDDIARVERQAMAASLPKVQRDPDLEDARQRVRQMDSELAVYQSRFREDRP